MKKKIQKALDCFNKRQSKEEHPDGYFDKQKRWYPSKTEEQYCCSSIRRPSGKWPFSLIKHCRSLKHIAAMFGLFEKELRQAYKKENPPSRVREGYKKVTYKDGKFFSIFDGSEYILGEERKETAQVGHKGGFYIYESLEDAKDSRFPKKSAFQDGPFAILKCQVAGKYLRLDNGKIAVSSITPIELIKKL